MYVPLKDLFITSQEHNGGRVTIGKNAMCKVVGIGNEKLKCIMFNL